MKVLKSTIQKLFTLTPMKITVFITSVFAVASYIQEVSTDNIPILSTLEHKALDLKFQLRGVQKVHSNVVIAAIDEKTIATYGQWPLDRGSVLAPMIERICSYSIKALGIDTFWPEHERGLNHKLKSDILDAAKQANLGDKFEKMLQSNSGDSALRKAFEKCGNRLVLGYSLTNEPPVLATASDQKDYETRKKSLIQDNKILDFTFTKNTVFPKSLQELNDSKIRPNTDFLGFRFGALLNNSTILFPSVSQGFFNNDAESDDGNYRHYTPVMMLDGAFLPSLALRMAMKQFSQSTPEGKTLDAEVSIFLPDQSSGRSMILRLKTPQDQINYPIDKAGRLITNYKGPNYSYPHISLAEIMSPDETISYTPTYSTHLLNGGQPNEAAKPVTYLKREFFKDKLVLIGSTIEGAHDLRPRPFDRNAFGVENHASALDNMINNDFLEKPQAETFMALLIGLYFLGLAYGLTISRLGAKSGAFFAVLTIAGLIYFDQLYLFNKKRIFFSAHLQILQFLSQYLLITILKYAKEESEKQFIRHAFDKFVSPDVIEQMMLDPTKLKLGGEKKPVTVLFSDIAGFTELSERIDVKTLSLFLNEYLGAMTDIIQKNGGTLDKYIGDAVMAFWGAPLPNPQHCQLAVKTAIEMQCKVIELNRSFKEKYGIEISIRIGINTGEVAVGNFGSDRVFSYTVIGDDVNLASRLEGINQIYGTSIIISEATHNMLSPEEFTCREIDLVKVKGKRKPVRIYQVIHDNTENAKRDLIPLFREGLSNYYARNWDRAILNFSEILKKYKEEKAASQFIERCRYFAKYPPQDDWDGSWEMKSK